MPWLSDLYELVFRKRLPSALDSILAPNPTPKTIRSNSLLFVFFSFFISCALDFSCKRKFLNEPQRSKFLQHFLLLSLDLVLDVECACFGANKTILHPNNFKWCKNSSKKTATAAIFEQWETRKFIETGSCCSVNTSIFEVNYVPVPCYTLGEYDIWHGIPMTIYPTTSCSLSLFICIPCSIALLSCSVPKCIDNTYKRFLCAFFFYHGTVRVLSLLCTLPYIRWEFLRVRAWLLCWSVIDTKYHEKLCIAFWCIEKKTSLIFKCTNARDKLSGHSRADCLMCWHRTTRRCL